MKDLLDPVISDGERAMLIFKMARDAYRVWCWRGGIEPNWDALPKHEKDRWAATVRASFRSLVGLVNAIAGEEDAKATDNL